MKNIDSEKENKILEKVLKNTHKNQFQFEIKGVSKTTRNFLFEFLNSVLTKHSVNPLYIFHIFSSVNELLYNAIKGNLKHVIIKDELLKQILKISNQDEKIDYDFIDILLETNYLKNSSIKRISPKKIKKKLESVFILEDKLKNRNEILTHEELSILHEIYIKLSKNKKKVIFKLNLNSDDLLIQIMNNSPIAEEDLERIKKSRKIHYSLFVDGHSGEFFRPDFIDEKESAGFGIGLVDEVYFSLGLNPLEYFTIDSNSRTTNVYLKFPLTYLLENNL